MKGVAVGFMAIAVAFTATGAFAESRPVASLGSTVVGSRRCQEVLDTVAVDARTPNEPPRGQTSRQSFTRVTDATVGSIATFVIEQLHRMLTATGTTFGDLLTRSDGGHQKVQVFGGSQTEQPPICWT